MFAVAVAGQDVPPPLPVLAGVGWASGSAWGLGAHRLDPPEDHEPPEFTGVMLGARCRPWTPRPGPPPRRQCSRGAFPGLRGLALRGLVVSRGLGVGPEWPGVPVGLALRGRVVAAGLALRGRAAPAGLGLGLGRREASGPFVIDRLVLLQQHQSVDHERDGRGPPGAGQRGGRPPRVVIIIDRQRVIGVRERLETGRGKRVVSGYIRLVPEMLGMDVSAVNGDCRTVVLTNSLRFPPRVRTRGANLPAS